MGIVLRVKDSHGQENQVTIDKNPDTCPICHHGIEVKDLRVDHYAKTDGSWVERVLRCPREKCQRIFIARYYDTHSGNHFIFHRCVPLECANPVLADEIKRISPAFVDVYTQAFKVDEMGLTLVAGPAYRKALEFLMKDYLISRCDPKEAENIKNTFLGTCIQKYATDERIKATALRATWLGNDETHYLRKWVDKDLEDMKKFIRLTMHWIESEELTKGAIAEMPAS